MLLIDEIDRADEEFEALLLELLSQFQITIPEIGTITAERRPAIILTANRTRALSDALRRRCLYHWIPFPGIDREIAILEARLPGAAPLLIQQTCLFVERIRAGDYRKVPGVSETLDWLRALTLPAPGRSSRFRLPRPSVSCSRTARTSGCSRRRTTSGCTANTVCGPRPDAGTLPAAHGP